jgi:nucleoid-associated protein YgaU
LYKSQPQTVAKAAPAPEPAPAPVQVAAKEKPTQLETKAKPAAVEEKALVKTSAAAAEKAPAMAKSGAAQEYVVQLGDTLSRLSERYYNSGNKWEKIYEANKDTLKNPNYIYVGMKLVIPPDA